MSEKLVFSKMGTKPVPATPWLVRRVNNCRHSPSASFGPYEVSNTLHLRIHFILTTILRGRHFYYAHFMQEETNSLRRHE